MASFCLWSQVAAASASQPLLSLQQRSRTPFGGKAVQLAVRNKTKICRNHIRALATGPGSPEAKPPQAASVATATPPSPPAPSAATPAPAPPAAAATAAPPVPTPRPVGFALERTHQLTAEQVQKATEKMNAYVKRVGASPDRRDGAGPYFLLHNAGEKVYGTALVFHGFSNRPHQTWRLAQYLFDNGWNVYQPGLAGHSFVPPDKYWPQVDLKEPYYSQLRESITKDPILNDFFANFGNKEMNPRQMAASLARLFLVCPELLQVVAGLDSGESSSAFQKYVTGNYLDYLKHAEERLGEVAELPGPVVTVGLSVGGATALALAAAQPGRVERTVAYAPLLKTQGAVRRQFVFLAGPLDLRETGWDPRLQFTTGTHAASDVLGRHVLDGAPALAKVPTLILMTENDDAADIKATEDFIKKLKLLAPGVPHKSYKYPEAMMVPHPMVDPEEVSQGMSNKLWQSMYQETFRFLTTGEARTANLADFPQDPDMPQVKGV